MIRGFDTKNVTIQDKGPCNVNPAYRSLLCKFNILYLAWNFFSGGLAPKPPGSLRSISSLDFLAQMFLSMGASPHAPGSATLY
jgi:hypothetical protein